MKKWEWILVLIVLIVCLFCSEGEKQKKTEPIAQLIDQNITNAVEFFKEGKASEGVNLLLDAVLLTGAKEDMPAGFVDNIESAKQSFQEGDFASGGRFVHDALIIIKDEAVVRESGNEKEEIAPIAQIMEEKLQEAKEAFIQGDADKGSQLILESILLIAPYTP